jgi:tRNA 5-methylaminomethyl-2-thiouridine biosynthesis bifunctional protein
VPSTIAAISSPRRPVVVLANAADLERLSPIGVPIASVRGQASYLPADALPAPRAVVIGHGYVLPSVEGRIVVGSSYDVESDDPPPTWRRTRATSPLARPRALRSNSTSMRRRSRAVSASAPWSATGCLWSARCPTSRRRRGATASRRGPASTRSGRSDRAASRSPALAGAILAASIDGGPLPVERDLAAAIDPCRFVRRARRRGSR